MEVLRITGSRRLHGQVQVGGSKNAALPMLAATLLTDEPVRLRNVPRVGDVATLRKLLAGLGVRTDEDAEGDLSCRLLDDSANEPAPHLVRSMRASFCVLGPLLARRGRAVVALPGGCQLGPRPVDVHLRGLAALGADIRVEGDRVVATAGRLRGATLNAAGPLGPSVTGTSHLMSTAALADGETVIHGAAQEPEVEDLGRFLCVLGADIQGLGTATIRVRGVNRLSGGTHRLIADRIEAATLLLAGAITRGAVTLTDAPVCYLDAIVSTLRAAGADIEIANEQITVSMASSPGPLEIVASHYPGLPTDVQPQVTALLALARGTSIVADRVFPSRFGHLVELHRLGARVTLGERCARVEGVERLHGSHVTAGDLRAVAALVVAGLAAEGETVIGGLQHLDRGYDRLEAKLRRLGAELCRERTGPPLSAWHVGAAAPRRVAARR